MRPFRRSRREPRRVPLRASAPAPFVVGVSRSGTTLLRLMLDSHPQLAVPAETHFVPRLIDACRAGEVGRDAAIDLMVAEPRWPHFELDPEAVRALLPADRALKPRWALRAFYTAYADAHAKARWGEKTPDYLRHMRTISRALPESRFVHLIRDARDVALSMVSLEHSLPDSPARAARRWTNQVSRARRQGAGLEHYLEIRYEQLVLDTEATLRRVCEFVELPWDGAMLDYHQRAGERLHPEGDARPRPGRPTVPAGDIFTIHALTGRPPAAQRVGRWRAEMSEEDRRACEAVAGPLLAELGYEVTISR